MTDIADMFTEPAEKPATILDRTPLERYANCPFQGAAVESGAVTDASADADSGNEVHRVIAEGTDGWVKHGIIPAETMRNAALTFRPDVHFDATDALSGAIRAIDARLRFLSDGQMRNRADILRYQGGEGERSGQLARDIPAPDGSVIRVTSEIDLLMAGPSEYVLDEIDYKSGRKIWTPEMVRSSFQFRLHAWLIFGTYPDCEQIRTRIHMTRMNWTTPPVIFARSQEHRLSGLVQGAIEARHEAAKALAAKQEPARWPDPSGKCLQCPAIHECPEVLKWAKALNSDPAGFAAAVEVRQIELDKALVGLRAYVDEHGEIELAGGRRYGCAAPKKPRNAPKNSYGFYELRGHGNGGGETTPPDN